MGQITLRVLGGIEVEIDGRRVSGLADTRAGFLLGYLVTERHRRHGRAELAGLIWPDDPEETGRTNLRQMLHHLRRRVGAEALEGRLVTTRDSVAFVPREGDWIDLEGLQEPDCCGQPGHDPLCGDACGRMADTLELYRGPLFGRDVETALSDSALGWLVRRRGGLRQSVLGVLDRLVDCLVQSGATDEAIRHIRQFLEREPFSEIAHRLLMQTLADAGQRAAALEQFDWLEQFLSRQLAVEPAPETRAQRDRLAGIPGDTGMPSVDLPVERRFVTVAAVWISARAITPIEERAAAVTSARSLARAALERHRGHVVVAHGGLLLAYYGYPAPLERTVNRAARAALAAIGAVAGGVQAGAALAAASTITGSDPDLPDPGGDVSTRVLALAGQARNAQLLVDESTRARLDARFRTIRADVADGGHHIWRVEAVSSPDPGGPRVPLIGRAADHAALIDAWKRAVAGQPVAVFLRGSAGIGKTRLVDSVTEAAAADEGRVFTLQAGPEDGVRVLGPVSDFLHRWLQDKCGGDDGDGAVRRRHLAASIGDGDAVTSTTVNSLAGLLEIPGETPPPDEPDPHRARDRIVAAIDQLCRCILRRPAILVYEDIHWADPTSLEWLRKLPQALSGRPVLVIATARPEAENPWPDDAARVIEPDRLTPEEADALVRHYGPSSGLADDVRGRIVARAEGVPLFLEGLAQSAEPDAESIPELPATVQELLLTRLEHLGVARTLAEAGAVLGDTFSRSDLLATATDDVPDAETALARLVEAGVLTAEGSGRRYRWRHAVYREAAYGALPRPRVAALHDRVADVLLSREEGRATSSPAIVAYHLEAAGRAQTAIGYRLRAGERALVAGAAREAADNFGRALEDTRNTNAAATTVMDAHIGLGMAALAMHGYGSRAVDEAFRGALELPRVTEYPQRYGRILWGLWMCASSFHGFAEAQRLGHAMAELADRTDDRGLRVAAQAALCTNALFAGTVTAAIEHGRRAQAIYEQGDHVMLATRFGEDPGLTSRAVAAWALWLAGEPERAGDEIDAAVTAADATDHAPTCGFVHTMAAVIAQRSGDPVAAGDAAEQVLAHVGESRYPLWNAAAIVLGGWARVHAGETGAVATIEEVVARIDRVMEGSATVFRLILADAQRHAGAFEAAWATTRDALAGIDAVGDEGLRAEVHLQRARLATATMDSVTARRELECVDGHAQARGAVTQQFEAAAIRAALPDASTAEVEAAEFWQARIGPVPAFPRPFVQYS